ncbi:hypothetical protein [Plantactinospora sp. CA-290183]|uniref:hypothetical protein n=1 Tax=Plantactinospora sp. CA-290183 TaxID=3240006 RepID=UPI003D91E5D2
MTSYSEYAALARHLSELHHSGERIAAQLAQHRGDAGRHADQLGQRLVLQYQRLGGLGQMIGKPVPPPPPGYVVVPPGVDAPPPGVGPVPPKAWPMPPGAAPPPPPPPGLGAPPLGPPPARYARPAPPSPPPPPGSPIGSAYPELPGAPARRALPATPATGPDPRAVPGQRPPAAPVSGAGGPPAPAADPGRELELARQALDAADGLITRAETEAQQAPLFPGLSMRSRALAVYFSCLGVITVIIWILLTASELHAFNGGRGQLTVLSWSCAGLPAMAFFVGYFVLSVWGKPRMVEGRFPRYPRLGFLICFLGAPLAFLVYFAVFFS